MTDPYVCTCKVDIENSPFCPWHERFFAPLSEQTLKSLIVDYQNDDVAAARQTATLRAACRVAMKACQDNLATWAYKDEVVLLVAYEACRKALQKRKRGKR